MAIPEAVWSGVELSGRFAIPLRGFLLQRLFGDDGFDMRKKISFSLALVLGGSGLNAATVTWGGAATTDVDNWVTSNVAFDDTVQSGHSLNWENVTVNTASINSGSNLFDVSFQAGQNYTIGHLFMYGQTFDLGGTTGGLEALGMTADFDASSFTNWSPVVALTDSGVTTYYRWNHSNNSFSGNGSLDFSVIGSNTFDLSQNGNAPNPATGIWGELNSVAADFAGTRDNNTTPNLQATSGLFQVGFIQWGASTNGDVNTQVDFTTAIDSWETTITFTPVPEPSSGLLAGMAALLLVRRRR